MNHNNPEKNEFPQGFIEIAQQFFTGIDNLTEFVIKGHLLLEEKFNSILRNCVYFPEFLASTSLRFQQKMQLVRAFCISPNGDGIWELISAINALRNGIAHSLDPDKRTEQFRRLKDVYLRELEDPALREVDIQQPDDRLFLLAFSLSIGFVQRIEQDSAMMNRFIGAMVAGRREQLRRSPAIESQPPTPSTGFRQRT